MIDLRRHVVQRAGLPREEPAVIVAVNEDNASYVVSWRGATVGPVWSLSGARYAVGQGVRVLVEHDRPVAVIP